LTPEAEEFDEALRKLQSFVTSLYGYEIGTPMVSVSYGTGGTNTYGQQKDRSHTIDNRYIPSNTQLMVNTTGGRSFYLEPAPQDGAQVAIVDVGQSFGDNGVVVYGNGRVIDGDAYTVLNTTGQRKQWMYRGDLGEWIAVSDLTADSESPFPAEFDDYLITWLAIRLSPRYQEQIAPATLDAFRNSKRKFVSRYSQTKQMYVDPALTRTGRNYWGYSSDTEFNNGHLD
jgi:hypothetical protein